MFWLICFRQTVSFSVYSNLRFYLKQQLSKTVYRMMLSTVNQDEITQPFQDISKLKYDLGIFFHRIVSILYHGVIIIIDRSLK